jgi:hypothetical protein
MLVPSRWPGNHNLKQNRKKNSMINKKINRVSLGYKLLPVTMVLALLGWIISCMKGNAAFPKPPIPLEPAVPPDPTQPVDMTTRMNNLQTAVTNAVGGGTIQTAAKNAALEAVYEGMDANAFYVQTVARTNLAQMLSSGYQAVSTNRGQAPLDTPAITGIDNDVPAQLDVHLTPVANALGYEVQTSLDAVTWSAAMFSPQARTITLAGQPTGKVVQVRALALGGSTGQSPWSMPGSSMVT